MADRMKKSGHDIKYHWTRFTRELDKQARAERTVMSPPDTATTCAAGSEVARIEDAF